MDLPRIYFNGLPVPTVLLPHAYSPVMQNATRVVSQPVKVNESQLFLTLGMNMAEIALVC